MESQVITPKSTIVTLKGLGIILLQRMPFWSKQMSNQNDQEPEDGERNLIGVGVALGIVFGAGLGVVLDNIAMGRQ